MVAAAVAATQETGETDETKPFYDCTSLHFRLTADVTVTTASSIRNMTNALLLQPGTSVTFCTNSQNYLTTALAFTILY